MKLMTADEVKRRLGEGEDAVLLSLEHWLQIAQHLKEHGEVWRDVYGILTSPICLKYCELKEGDCSCENCPLYQIEGQSCCEWGGCYEVFAKIPTYEHALGVVAALARCKSPEPEVPQFYIWHEGELPVGKVGLRLMNLVGDAIRLYAVDKDGRPVSCGWLFQIAQDGDVYLPVSVNPNLGLDLTGTGRLRVKQEVRCES